MSVNAKPCDGRYILMRRRLQRLAPRSIGVRFEESNSPDKLVVGLGRQAPKPRKGAKPWKSVSGTDPARGFLIADDHAIFAEALKIYLERTYSELLAWFPTAAL